ncbi:MAG: hypothetical protein A2Y57_00755 [Candidatus Woykebacteria bacterium RBG_13_40_7b]|uniref:Uncharacterized protein n=1 Tax=Candidatus Woykebacteria bacterium RBG_13_40_7b TaxID=1802594 RepID=A0A1G1WAC3_9BACT|nr:MAG: hypothetical protein A2Y57_00755 [Candidatus Woykebacteria bacterium RBG_13_40_7b]
MPNDKNNQKIFNLEERTAKFGEEVIKFCLKIPRNPVTTLSSIKSRIKKQMSKINLIKLIILNKSQLLEISKLGLI